MLCVAHNWQSRRNWFWYVAFGVPGQFIRVSVLIWDPFIFLKSTIIQQKTINSSFVSVYLQQRRSISLGFPKVFITDCKTALHNTLTNVFTESKAHLCAWNIMKNFKKQFPLGDSKACEQFMKLWNSMTHSKTVESFKERLSELKHFLSKSPAVLEYLKISILPVKEHFVITWASHFPHLRNLNTSCVEAGHAFIEIFISNSSRKLSSVWKFLCHAVDHKISHIHEGIHKGSLKKLTNIPCSFFFPKNFPRVQYSNHRINSRSWRRRI
ncbi:uncharacterized protein VP01_2301g7 [Puccinia sorghi]|uniref:MULE transposase domain-containing protein n=1 Tax=Puccinia sorghi TaxID=27349 RepID=A0A0L6V827_9BASI|nr:uncharacterized protein VP01_2301g7 [Puccinia sorghi]